MSHRRVLGRSHILRASRRVSNRRMQEFAEPRLAAAGLTTIIAGDTAIEYSLAFKWKITRAAAGTFVFTTPDWLSGKLDFQGDGFRQILQTVSGAGFDLRVRIVHQREQNRGEFERGQGQGASRSHQAGFAGSVWARVAFCLLGQSEADDLSRLLHGRASSHADQGG